MLIGKPAGRRSLGKNARRSEDDIRYDLKGSGVYEKLEGTVNAVVNLWIP